MLRNGIKETSGKFGSDNYLGLCEAEVLGQCLSLGPHHVVIALEGVLQLEQLRR